jgi:hypothetical protein
MMKAGNWNSGLQMKTVKSVHRYMVNVHKNISLKKMYEGWKEQRKH